MLKRYQQILGGMLRVLDAATIGGVWLLAYGLRFYTPFVEVTRGFPSFSQYASLAPLLMIFWVAVFSGFGLYRSDKILRRTTEVIKILRAHLAALVLFTALTYFISEYRYSRLVIVYFAILSGVTLITLRMGIRNFLRLVRLKGRGVLKAVAIGSGPALDALLFRTKKFPELGVRVDKILPVAEIASLHQVLSQIRPQQVIIALPVEESHRLPSILGELKDETADLLIVPDFTTFIRLGCEVEDFDGIPLLNVNDSPLDGWGATLKRVTDIILSGAAILILFPLFLAIAALIRITSPGSIFYKQERMGIDGRVFSMLKFRSMRADAEKESGAVWARANDHRRTWFGSFLRATSLDELPQLWNVLKGDMSLVGPRPERPIFVDKFRHEIPNYMLRHKVRAGMTGWAQVNGWRGNTSLENRIQCDLYYIKNWSYLLDLKILVLTIWKGFVNKNAY